MVFWQAEASELKFERARWVPTIVLSPSPDSTIGGQINRSHRWLSASHQILIREVHRGAGKGNMPTVLVKA